MKRKYINPTLNVVWYEMEQSILSGSKLYVDQEDTSYDASSSYSNKQDGIWGESKWE